MLASAEEHYRRQARLAVLAVQAARRSWARVSPESVTGSWRVELPRLAVLLTAVQATAARDGAEYVSRAVEEQNLTADPEGSVAPMAFAGVASDGRSLVSLLDQPHITLLTEIGDGADPRQGLRSGLASLERIVATQVQDAGRVAAGVGIVARPRISGYVRMFDPPSCGSCTVLASRFYRWDSGFLRHLGCGCRHVPASEDTAGDLRTDLRAVQAVDTRHGGIRSMQVAGRPPKGGRAARLTPESIYAGAEDRADAIRLLKLHGYLL